MHIGRRSSSADAGTSDAAGEGSANAALVRKLGRDELEMVFLGTGAAIPAKYRNVSGIYVNLFARGGIMLDCGAPIAFWSQHDGSAAAHNHTNARLTSVVNIIVCAVRTLTEMSVGSHQCQGFK